MQDVFADPDALVCVFEAEDQVALGYLVDGGEGPVEKEAQPGAAPHRLPAVGFEIPVAFTIKPAKKELCQDLRLLLLEALPRFLTGNIFEIIAVVLRVKQCPVLDRHGVVHEVEHCLGCAAIFIREIG